MQEMKKIMFNDKYGLTKAVLEGRKTQTRRNFTLALHKKEVGGALVEVSPTKVYFEDGKWKFIYDDYAFLLPKINYPKYKIGEVVAVAQKYEDIFSTPIEFRKGIGWKNKMYVSADLMPNLIRITDVRIQRLQDISDEDCLKEGIEKMITGCEYYQYSFYDENKSLWHNYKTPREAFAHLIDKVSGKGTWDSNPYVFVYDFELVKQ